MRHHTDGFFLASAFTTHVPAGLHTARAFKHGLMAQFVAVGSLVMTVPGVHGPQASGGQSASVLQGSE